jgi:hypothetical protein
MIRTSRHLKDMVRKMSSSDSAKAQIIIRNYIMERFHIGFAFSLPDLILPCNSGTGGISFFGI